MSENDEGFKAALEEAKAGAKEGGVPIGACLVDKDGKILGQGHNMRVQKGSPILHVCRVSPLYNIISSPYLAIPTSDLTQGEMSALEAAGRLPASAYKGSTMYTTLSPCDMCTGACILYKVSRVVLGENNTLVGGEDYLRKNGIEVINLKNAECEELMKTFIRDHPEDWYAMMRE